MQAVTISVLTYNSSKFVLETLESIKAQTYPKLILHICDDCSTDNTIALCRDWIKENKSRFESTDIIIPEHNTGVSANCNRAWDACMTKYQKEIAGDDILLPNCIADNIKYVSEHTDAILVFSRMSSFGASKEKCRYFDEEVYLYDFFNWPSSKQYDFLYNERNCLPAPACFVNIDGVRQIGLRHDERIPMQEDVAKWLNALKMGIVLHFFDSVTVKYRLHNNSLSNAELPSPQSRESCALYWFYYHFIPEYEKDREKAISLAVDEQMKYYNRYYNEVKSVRMSLPYRAVSQIVRLLIFGKSLARIAFFPFFAVSHPWRCSK